MLAVTIVGGVQASAALAKLADGAKGLDGYSVLVGTGLAYGWGIEFGHHRGGGLARRAGPALYLTGALKAEAARIEDDLAKALPSGGAATRRALLQGGYRIERHAKSTVPVGKVRGGSLRRSLHTLPGGA